MAKRGRKPKERKGYFYEKEEEAIIQYIHEENVGKKRRKILKKMLDKEVKT